MTSAVMAQSEQPHHVISVGADGFGWSGLSQVFDWDKDKSGIKDHTSSEGKLNLNYSYIFDSKVMLGVELKVDTEKSELKETNGDKTTDESSETRFGVSLGYNFNDDIYRSWWIKGTVGTGHFENETKVNGSKTKFDYDYKYFTIAAGKRISLESWGLKNVSYNPSISFTGASVSGDAEDAGLDGLSSATLELIKIDILF